MRLEAIAAPAKSLVREEFDRSLSRSLDPLFSFLAEVPFPDRAVVRVSDGTQLQVWDGTKQQILDTFLIYGRVAIIYNEPEYHRTA